MGADRLAAQAAARGIAGAAGLRSSGVDDLAVQVHGFPFLTQVAAGSLDRVTGTAARLPVGGFEVRELRLEAGDVDARAPWEARRVQVDGVVAFDTIAAVLTERAGTPVVVAPGDAGGLMISATWTVHGVTADVRATVEPHLVDGAIAVQVTGVEAGGVRVPAEVLSGDLGGLLRGGILPADVVPQGLRFTAVALAPDGLRVGMEGRDLALGDLSR